MSLDHQLQRWVGAGVITAEQAQRIRQLEQHEPAEQARRAGVGQRHEPDEPRPTFLYAVAGLGGLAIAVGLVSIVAANWGDIPGRVKIAIDLALVAALGLGVWQWDRRGPAWAFEAAVIALWGLVLASIALIGQVYQLGGEPHHALLAWTVLTALLMSRARGGLAASLWILGLQVTWATWCVWLADEWDTEMFALGTVYWPPLLCLALGRWSAIQRVRPLLAGVLEAIGWGELVLCATLGTFAFYVDTSRESWDGAYPAILASAALTVALATLLRASLPERLLLVACFALAHGPLLTSTGGMQLPAAITFVGLWLLIAWSAHHARDVRLLNLATAMIGIRILAIYFEVFGSLLDTGLGLISGGLVTLGLVWLWTRKRRQFARELGGPA